MRRRHGVFTAALALAVTAGSAVALAPTATAAATYTVFGDVTGDGLPDRVALTGGHGGDCYAVVGVGRAGGGYSVGQRVVLPANHPGIPRACPGSGVFLHGHTPALDRVATTTGGLQTDSRPVQVFSFVGAVAAGTAKRVSEFYGQDADGIYQTVDLDGDGNDDWRTSGEFSEDLWLQRGNTWRLIYSSGSTNRVPSAFNTIDFVDLNRAGGTDAVVTTSSRNAGEGAVDVVDGRTGALQTLVTGASLADQDVYGFTATTVDLNGDAYPDLSVTPQSDSDPDLAPLLFLNKSQGGRWFFVRQPAAA